MLHCLRAQISQTGYKERELQAFDARCDRPLSRTVRGLRGFGGLMEVAASSGMVDTDTSGTNDHFEPQTRKVGSAANLEGLGGSLPLEPTTLKCC
jgi:hypothetical protein